jgi:hypothetical protein
MTFIFKPERDWESKWHVPPALVRYLQRIGATPKNLRKFIVKEITYTSPKGKRYYDEKAIITISDDGVLDCSSPAYEPNKDEKAELTETVLKDYLANKPKQIDGTLSSAEGEVVEELVRRGIDRKNIWICMNTARTAVRWMQYRAYDGKDKSYYPISFWSDGEWRTYEPDGPLAFWKPMQKRGCVRLMIHEGAKAASYVDWLCNAPEARELLRQHPWGETLVRYEHWGMMGGALGPWRVDWNEVRKAKFTETVYACDADPPGQDALQKVSECYGEALIGIRCDSRWGNWGWDMADPMPEKLFDGARYIGPQLEELMVPATWATKLVPVPGSKSKKMVAVLLPAFKAEWTHSVTPPAFIHQRWPSRVYFSEKEFNNRMAPFSHVSNLAGLLKAEDRSKVEVLTYDPSRASGIIARSQHSPRSFNVYQPSDIRPQAGDAGPWLEYLNHLVPIARDRTELLRWCATLFARPAVRMRYGVLLVSEVQGVGKSTLGNIIERIVGKHNVSYPTDSDLHQSQFNEWKMKRVAIVHEIYAGESVKVYNRLKDTITEISCDINRKNVPPFRIVLWCHVFACSNAKRALKLPDEDRRWFLPGVTEILLPREWWAKFYQWLETGGYEIILHWAQEWLQQNEPVQPGVHAPSTFAKSRMIEEGYSDGLRLVADTLDLLQEAAKEEAKQIVVTDHALVQWIKSEIWENRQSDKLEKPRTVRALARAHGWFVGEKRQFIAADKNDATLIATDPNLVKDKTVSGLMRDGVVVMIGTIAIHNAVKAAREKKAAKERQSAPADQCPPTQEPIITGDIEPPF